MFMIDDDRHAEPQAGEYPTREDALAEIVRRAALGWDEPPNRAPCMSWKTCGREYQIIEYDDSVLPWRTISVEPIMEIGADGVRWLIDRPDRPV